MVGCIGVSIGRARGCIRHVIPGAGLLICRITDLGFPIRKDPKIYGEGCTGCIGVHLEGLLRVVYCCGLHGLREGKKTTKEICGLIPSSLYAVIEVSR